MKNRIRTSVLIFKKNKLLLINQFSPKRNSSWWIPPAGGLDGSETVFESAKREAFEEAGLTVEIEKLVYIQQFISFDYLQNNIELFFLGKIKSGTETLANLKGLNDESLIKDIRYFSQKELQKITVYPEELKNQIWKDKKEGFPTVKFLGVKKDK